MVLGNFDVAYLYTNKGSTGIVYTYMGTSSNDDGEKPVPPDKSTVILLLGTIGDTTWRMLVPIIGFMLIGLWGDKHLHTVPWLTAIGLIIGILLAAVLVLRQVKRIRR